MKDVTDLKHATERIFRALSQRDEIIERVNGIIHSTESYEMYCVLGELVNHLDANIEAEERGEDQSWFDGLSSNFTTKEDAMRNAAKARIRKYFSNAKESFEKVSCHCMKFLCIYNVHDSVIVLVVTVKCKRFLMIC